MTKDQAVAYVERTADDEDHDEDDVQEAFVALTGRKPTEDERGGGLWSHCCRIALS